MKRLKILHKYYSKHRLKRQMPSINCFTDNVRYKTDVTPATKSRDFDARQGVARQSRKCDRECRMLRHGASHSRATRFRNRALLYSMRL